MTKELLRRTMLVGGVALLWCATAQGAPKSVLYDAGTQTYHVFEVIKTPGGGTWPDAFNDAGNFNYQGHTGHLATIRSSAENDAATDIMRLIINGGGSSWIGATDDTAFGAAAEGDWVWVADDVNGGTPDSFWSGPDAGNGGMQVGTYSNWNAGEPNDVGNEDYAATNGEPNGRGWFDFSGGRGEYIVEYEVPVADIGQEYVNGYRYEAIHGAALTWTAARAAAQAMTPPTGFLAGDLAIIDSQALQDFIMSDVLDAQGGFGPGAITGFPVDQGNWNAWFGATDEAVEGDWRWLDGTLFWQGDQNGSPVGGAFNNWPPGGEPNNVNDEDYAVLNPFAGDGEWFDIGAQDTRRTFIVEWRPVPEPATAALVGLAATASCLIRRRRGGGVECDVGGAR